MYPTTKPAALVGAHTGEYLAKTIDNLVELGVTFPKSVTAAREEWQRLDDHFKEVRRQADPEVIAEEAVNHLTAGQGNLLEVLTAATAQSMTKTSEVSRIFDRAKTNTGRILYQAVKAAASPIADSFTSRVDANIATIRAVIPDDFHVDYLASVKNGPKPTDWLLANNTVREAWESLQTLYKTFHDWRKIGIFDYGFTRDDYYEWRGDSQVTAQKAGDVIYYDVRSNLHPNRFDSFVWGVVQGLEPGLFTTGGGDSPARAAQTAG